MGTENVRMLHFWGHYLKGDFSHNCLCLCMRLKLYYSGSDCCQIWLRLSFKLWIHYIITTTIVKISPATKIWHCYFSCLCSHANQLWLKLQIWADLAESSALVPLHKQTKKKKVSFHFLFVRTLNRGLNIELWRCGRVNWWTLNSCCPLGLTSLC